MSMRKSPHWLRELAFANESLITKDAAWGGWPKLMAARLCVYSDEKLCS